MNDERYTKEELDEKRAKAIKGQKLSMLMVVICTIVAFAGVGASQPFYVGIGIAFGCINFLAYLANSFLLSTINDLESLYDRYDNKKKIDQLYGRE